MTDPMVAHAIARGSVRVQIDGNDYATLATLVRWVPASKHCRVQYATGAQRTIRKDQITSVIAGEATR